MSSVNDVADALTADPVFTDELMNKISAAYFRQQIEQYFDDRELDVICERRRRAYTIIRGDDGLRLARLRPTGNGDEVELYSWDDDRWQPVGTSGNVMPLPDALEYITDDPDELFCCEPNCEIDTAWGDLCLLEP